MRGDGQEPRRFPCSLSIRSTKEEPNSVPAASPRLPRSTSPWSPDEHPHAHRGVPRRPSDGYAPHPAHIHQIGAGKPLRDVPTLVPRVLLFVTLAGPTPSGSASASRLCQGCSHPLRHLPEHGCPQLHRPATTGTATKVSHLHSNRQRLMAHVDTGRTIGSDPGDLKASTRGSVIDQGSSTRGSCSCLSATQIVLGSVVHRGRPDPVPSSVVSAFAGTSVSGSRYLPGGFPPAASRATLPVWNSPVLIRRAPRFNDRLA